MNPPRNINHNPSHLLVCFPDQRGHRAGSCNGYRHHRAKGVRSRHLQPGQFHGSDRRRDLQETQRLRPEAVRPVFFEAKCLIPSTVLTDYRLVQPLRCHHGARVFTRIHAYLQLILDNPQLDVVRASTFVAEIAGDLKLAPKTVVPVVGGHSGITVRLSRTNANDSFLTSSLQIVPLLSQAQPPLPFGFAQDKLTELSKRIQFGGDEVLKAKDGSGSATLSMAYAGERFADLVIRASLGETGLVAPSYVNLAADADGGAALRKELGKDLEYFSSRIALGKEGVEKILPLGNLSPFEQELIKAALPELDDNIAKGVSFIQTPKL